MSSREIAELTGKEHKHVLADVRKMLDELGIHSAEFSAQYTDPTGRKLPEFNLPKRETMILVSGYSITLRAKIVDRWQELEAKLTTEAALTQPHPQPQPPALALPQDYLSALKALTMEVEQRQALAQQNEVLSLENQVLAPKADFADNYLSGDGSKSLSEVAKTLGPLTSRSG